MPPLLSDYVDSIIYPPEEKLMELEIFILATAYNIKHII
tara:strand:- start:89 stop:205 length:117 start_codon:yes stop_codon:yes gene_type:complete